ncbi:hypothetical protein D8M04_12475 [Oceanobacillus piezotolerans]|uniref:YdbS-like PH domain-containing protein n=1 Tax=Oceanobacillus piezotolerans TaxID=2448030 RepID=A0A498DGG9_9BACI|nr:PH domain-containing protein [Oceanobacillus piezotolerans]RLL43732.1 hypothetical protein D8M04_12475 [Oceanobacillus piezotolerans]
MRYHPLTMVFQIYQLVKNSFLIALFLFVIKRDSAFWLFEYGRYVFVIAMLLSLVYIVVSWIVEKYEWKDQTFYIYKGIFVKHTSIIPFSKVQNVTKKTTFFHKVIGLTSLTLETAMDGNDDAIRFPVLSKEKADYLVELVQSGDHPQNIEEVSSETAESTQQKQEAADRVIHFTPSRNDLWRASFTSLSFLAIIPIVLGLIENIGPLLPDTDLFEGIFQVLLDNKGLLVGVIVLTAMLAAGFGVVRTFIRYGKYEISSNSTHIFIDRGVLDESSFMIEKEKIQGLEMHQTWLKRIFGLVEVKLISSANTDNKDGSVSVNSLYPFLPLNKAYQLIEEVLPIYQLNNELQRLPKQALWLKLCRPSWIWILATIGLGIFKPNFLQIQQAWWILSLVILFVIILHRILDYMHTRYAVTSDQVQWWHGGLTSRMFITKRKKVIELTYSQTRLQKYFQVASITTVNRSNPPHMETLDDIPVEYGQAIENWYLKRQEDVLLEKNL